MNKWICTKCGVEILDKPLKNAICNKGGCKGRYQKYTQCKCGKWFKNSLGNKYCSSKCSGRKESKSRIGKITKKCFFCGKEFERYSGNVKSKKQFCNIACMRAYEKSKKVRRICKQCGKQFYVYYSSIDKTNASGNYCSRECYNSFLGKQEHGKYYRGDFEKIKKEYFSGVQFCAICGTTKNIHIHHIIPYRITQDNSLDNLIPLCRKHHKIVENIWLPFIDMISDKNKAKQYINLSLRSRQYETRSIIWSIQNSKSNMSQFYQ